MKKLLSVFLFLVVPLMIAVPGYMGWQTQRYMESMAAYVDGLPGYGASWENYKRGWFNSRGVLNVVLKGVKPLAESPDVALPFNVELSHGPLLLGDTIGLGWFNLQVSLLDKDEAYLQRVLTVTEDGPIYQLTARMALQGTTFIKDRWLPFEYREDDAQLVVGSYSGEGSVGVDRVLIYAFNVPSVNFVGDAASDIVTLEKVAGDISVNLAKLQSANVAPATFKFSAGNVMSKKQEGEAVDFLAKGLVVTGDTWLDDIETLFSTRSSISLKTLLVPSAKVDLSNMVLDLAYTDISLAFIEQYQNVVAAAPDDAGPSFWQEHIGLLVLQQLLPSSPSLAVEAFKFDSPQGTFSAESRLSIDGPALAAGNLNPQNPMAVLPYLIFNLNVNADEAVVKQIALRYVENQLATQEGNRGLTKKELAALSHERAEQLLGLIVAQQFITLENKRYESVLDYEKGQAVLNGQPMPLPF